MIDAVFFQEMRQRNNQISTFADTRRHPDQTRQINELGAWGDE